MRCWAINVTPQDTRDTWPFIQLYWSVPRQLWNGPRFRLTQSPGHETRNVLCGRTWPGEQPLRAALDVEDWVALLGQLGLRHLVRAFSNNANNLLSALDTWLEVFWQVPGMPPRQRHRQRHSQYWHLDEDATSQLDLLAKLLVTPALLDWGLQVPRTLRDWPCKLHASGKLLRAGVTCRTLVLSMGCALCA